jgi:hypothetical protein
LSLSTVHRDAVWIVVPGKDAPWAAVTQPPVVRLQAERDPLYLRSTIQFTYDDDVRFPGERKVVTSHYAHTVGESDDLRHQLYSWEWAANEPRYPHLHLRRSNPTFEGLGKLHIPTGRVFYEEVLLFLVQDHGVRPVRDDWRDVMAETHRRVVTFASWGGGRRMGPPPGDAQLPKGSTLEAPSVQCVLYGSSGRSSGAGGSSTPSSSTCSVIGKRSNARSAGIDHPASSSTRTSRANDAASHET